MGSTLSYRSGRFFPEYLRKSLFWLFWRLLWYFGAEPPERGFGWVFLGSSPPAQHPGPRLLSVSPNPPKRGWCQPTFPLSTSGAAKFPPPGAWISSPASKHSLQGWPNPCPQPSSFRICKLDMKTAVKTALWTWANAGISLNINQIPDQTPLWQLQHFKPRLKLFPKCPVTAKTHLKSSTWHNFQEVLNSSSCEVSRVRYTKLDLCE